MSASSSSAAGESWLAARAAHQRRWLWWRAQKMAFWVLYDFLGSLILLNLITLAAVAMPVWLLARLLPGQIVPPAVLAGGLAAMAMAGQANLIAALLAEEEFSLRVAWRGIAAFGGKALALCAVYAGSGMSAVLGLWFYWVRVAPERPLAGALLASVCAGTGAVTALSSFYGLPALVHRRGSLTRALHTSLLLAAWHPALTVALVLPSAAYGVVLATPPGLLLLSTLPLVALSCSAYELLDRAYKLEEALAQGETAPAGTLDEHDVFLNRGFTDLLFPWKL